MRRLVILGFLGLCLGSELDNSIPTSTGGRYIGSGDELVNAVVNDCLAGDQSVVRCLKIRVLDYLDASLNGGKRSLEAEDEVSDEELDSAIVHRVKKYITSHDFKLHMPDLFFQRATLVFKPASRALTDFDVEFPPPSENESRAISQAREDMQHKMVMPFLMMMKMMSKMITPVIMMMVGMKAMKALVLSKVAILLVGVFLFMQLCKKHGMMMPPGMGAMSVEPAPSSAYGPPSSAYGPPPTAPMNSYGAPPSNSYGSPASSSPAGSSSSYDQAPSSWEPAPSASNNQYSRVYDPHQVAYNAYSTIGASSSSSTKY